MADIEAEINKNDHLRIFLLDDSDEGHFFSEYIKDLNPTFMFYSGKDAEQFATYIDAHDPDIIFLDINMPKKNGIQCLQEIKAHPRHKTVPVIMYSMSDREEDIALSYQAGAHYYLVKPYSYMNFVKSLITIFRINWRQVQPVPSKSNFVINMEAVV